MATKKKGVRGAGPKRPYSTIDLKAVDVSPNGDGKGTDTPKSAAKSAFESGAPNPADTSAKPTASAASAATIAAAGTKAGTASGASATSGQPSGTSSSKSDSSGAPQDSTLPPGGGKGSDGGNTPAPPTSGGGFGGFLSHMMAGIIGAILTLFGAKFAGDQIGLQLPNGASVPSPAITQRLAALEKSIATGPGKADGNVAAKLSAAEAKLAKLEGLSKSIEDLKATQAKLATQASALQAGGGNVPTALGNRLDKLEQTLTSLGAAANAESGKGGRIQQLAAISGRVNDLEGTLKNQLAALRADIVQEIDQRVSPSAEASEAAKSGTQRLDRDVAALRSDAAKIDQRLVDIKVSTDRMQENVKILQENTGSLKDKFAILEQSVARPKDIAIAVGPITSKIGSLEQNLQNVVKSEADRQITAERIVLALELGNLKRALDRGQDFSPELAEVKRVSGGKLDLGALEKHKSTGVPTLGALQEDFRPIAFKMIDAQALKENASVVDQLMHGARSLVRIRKVNHETGDKSVEAVVGRMETALKDGRLSDVLNEAKALPKKVLTPARSWLDKVRARQSVDSAIASIEDKLKSSLGGGAGGKG